VSRLSPWPPSHPRKHPCGLHVLEDLEHTTAYVWKRRKHGGPMLFFICKGPTLQFYKLHLEILVIHTVSSLLSGTQNSETSLTNLKLLPTLYSYLSCVRVVALHLRHTLYHLSHASSSFYSGYFWDRLSHLYSGWPEPLSSHLCFLSSWNDRSVPHAQFI
jgi:hypothetical protein